MNACYYCSSTHTEPIVENNGKVYLIRCLDNPDGFCKPTTIVQTETCPDCEKSFEFRFDPGWNEVIACNSCKSKRMKEYFESPEMTAALKEAVLKKDSWLDKIEKDNSWKGGFITVPFKLSE